MTRATAADAIRKGIELLEENGWIQGEMHTVGGYCSLGAVRQGALLALADDDVEHTAESFRGALEDLRMRADQVVRDVIKEKYDYSSIVFWNDNIRRTREEVLGVFHEALERAES
ncbi:hypothetical protein GS534_24420 [Rhodococcus hoagii]|nr:hypothetical protein [Prescottella equi]MBM4617926.1 hypothetical protein [Prescottella equi]NKS33175.1 hypothetical protein [Prescottella equi]